MLIIEVSLQIFPRFLLSFAFSLGFNLSHFVISATYLPLVSPDFEFSK